MASFLVGRFTTKLRRSTLSPSSLFSSRLISRNPDSVRFFSYAYNTHSRSPTFSPEKPTNPISNPSTFITSCSNSTTFCNPQTPSEEKPIYPNPLNSNLLKSCPTSTQAQYNEKPRNPYLNLIRSYSSSAMNLKLQTLPQGKPTKPCPSFFKPYSNTTQTPPGEKDKNPGLDSTSSSSSPSSDGSDSEKPKNPSLDFELQDQEIVGPTVERDVSALAEETRKVLQNLNKTVYELSKVVGLLGLAQLSCGAWIAYSTGSPPLSEVSIQSFCAFAFPFSLAFLLRQVLKPMVFLKKMEEKGRLHILTQALQVSKCLNLLFLRTRVISFTCIVGILIGLLFATGSNLNFF